VLTWSSPSICSICVPILENELEEERHRKRKEEEADSQHIFDTITQAAIMGGIL